MKINKTIAIAVLLFGLLMGGLAAGVLYSQRPLDANAAPSAQQGTTCVDDDDVQHEADNEADDGTEADACSEEAGAETQDQIESPAYTGSITVDQTQTEGISETDESAALQGQATITAEQAQAAAEAANAGAKATKVELDNENGVLVYSVQLDNGLDVKVDAGNGSILQTEQADGDNKADEAGEVEDANDTDNVQEEHDGQADDASETPGAEDAAGQ